MSILHVARCTLHVARCPAARSTLSAVSVFMAESLWKKVGGVIMTKNESSHPSIRQDHELINNTMLIY